MIVPLVISRTATGSTSARALCSSGHVTENGRPRGAHFTVSGAVENENEDALEVDENDEDNLEIEIT